MNTSAQTSPIKPTDPTAQKKTQLNSQVGGMAKEQSGGSISGTETVLPVSVEIQPHKEVVDAGLSVHPETVLIPPDLKTMGVVPSGSSVPVSTAATVQIVLPLPDQKIEEGLHMQVYSALRWLSEWCIRKLKKAHMTLKVVHGKVLRVPYKTYE